MVHFRLKKEADNIEEMVPVEFEGFGEETYDMLCERVYPIYSRMSLEVDKDGTEENAVAIEDSDAAFRQLNDALTTERNRQWGAKEAELSKDPEAAKLQEVVHDLPKTMAERIVKEEHRRKIVETPPGSDKIQ